MRWLPFALLTASILGCSSSDATTPPGGGAADASTPDVDRPETSGPVREAGADVDHPDANDGGVNVDDGGADAADGMAEIHPANVAAAATYPQAQLFDPEGAVLTAPKIVTVSFASMDPALRTHVEQFDDVITTTPWWTAVTDGYCAPAGSCVGKGVAGGHVTLNETPAATYDDDIDLTKP